MTVVANAWVQINPSMKGFYREVGSTLKGLDKPAAAAGASMGSKITAKLGKTLKHGAIGAGVTAGGVLAGSLAKGMGRLTAIEGAQAKLKGLGNSAEDVSAIMDNALGSVKGTAFGLGEAASTSAMMVASGIKPGKELESTLKTVADTAAIAGRDMGDVGLIFGSIAARGKLQGDDMLQLMSSGVPVLQNLGEHLGKTSEEVSDMVSKGQIDFATFEAAMREKVGGAALEMGNTFTGAAKNVGAAMGRFGAALAGPAFTGAIPVFNSINKIFSSMTDAIKTPMERIQKVLTPSMERLAKIMESRVAPFAADVAEKLGNLAATGLEKALAPGSLKAAGDLWKKFSDSTKDVWESVKPLIPAIGDLMGPLSQIGGTISVATWQSYAKILEALAPLVENVLVPLVQQVADLGAQHPGAVSALVTSFIGFKAVSTVTGPLKTFSGGVKTVTGAMKTLRGITKSGGGLAKGLVEVMGHVKSGNPILSRLAKIAGKVPGILAKVGKAASLAGKGIKLIGLAMKANPVGAAITIFTIAAAALWAFFTKTETGRKLWKKLVGGMKRGWEMIKTAFTVGTIILAKKVMGMIQHFQIFKARVSAAFQQVKNKFTAFVNGVKSIPGKIKAAFSGAGHWLLDAGKAIIRGLANGIRAAGHVIGDAVRAVVPDAMEKFVPGLSIGGVIPAFARGGVLPDIPGVSRSQRDPILGWSADRKRPVARVEPGEFIVNREATARHLPLLAAINGGRLNPRKGDLGLPGYADGGVVGFGDVMRLLKGGYGAPGSLEHARYTWAGGLMASWGDCSGLQSAIASLVAGVTLAGRKFSTATQAAWLSANKFVRGLGPKKNAYAVGFLNGGPGGGHTAGTIYDAAGNAVNVEMGGARGDGQIGGQAAGAADFPNVFWHPLKAAARVLSTSLDGAKVDTGDGAKEVDWGSAASLFEETKKRFGVFDTGGLLASGSAAVNLSGRPERVLPPQLTTIFDKFVQLLMAGGSGGAPGGSGVLRYTQLVRDAEKGLAQTRQKSGVTAKEVAAAEETVRLAQVTAAKDTATTVAGVFRSPLDSLSKLAEMSGNQQAIIATQVLQAAKQIAEVISGLVVDVFQAMSAAAGVVADHFAALREQGKAVADLRATIVGLGIDFVKAQIDMAAAARQRRLTEVSGQVAVAEAIASVAQRQAAFDAQRKADAKAQLALYDDLSAGLDRFRWNMAGGFQQAMGDMAAWSDESHALYSELLAAQTGIQLAQQVAAKNNLEAVYKQVEASFKLSDAVQGLQFAAKQLQIMSKNHFGMDQAGATAGERYAQLTQELAEIEAKKADIKTWGNPANWFNGYYENANRRQAQIRAELDKLAASKEFRNAGIDRAMVDKIVASAGASGFFGAGDQIGDLIKNSALGDATRALQRAEYEKRQLEIEKQKADLGTQVSKGRAEVDYLAKLQPLQDLIESLQLEKASHESAAKGWREKNEDVRRAYMRVSATQAEGAQKIVQIPDGKSAFSFDEVQDIITELGGSLEQIQGRVQRLEVPPVSGGTLIKTRRG